MKLLLKHQIWIGRGEKLGEKLKSLIWYTKSQVLAFKTPRLKKEDKSEQSYNTRLHGSH